MKKEDTQPVVKQLLENRDRLFSYILSMVRDWNTAEDIFQDVSVIILTKAEKQQDPIEYPSAWFREIARRSILDFWKKNKRKKQFLSEKTLDIVTSLYAEKAATPSRSEISALRKCLQKLPAKFRSLISLRYGHKLSMKMIAERLSKTPGSIQVSLSRIRSQLLACLKKEVQV